MWGEVPLHIDDHDAAVPLFAVLLLFVFLILGTVPLIAVVPHGDLQARLFLTAALFLFAASNLFDDPGFEHDEGPLAKCLQYPTLLVKFGISHWER